jgi:general secretion pathway protein I
LTPARGFTLVEVLVALVIVAMGTLAVAGQIGQAARNARLMQIKTLASWIALNKVTELRLVDGLPAASKDTGDIDYAGRTWAWRSEIRKPPGDVQNFMRIEVTVALADDPDTVIADATGFVGRGGGPAPRRPFDVRLPDGGGGNPNPGDGGDKPDPPSEPTPPDGDLTPRGDGT